MDHPQDAAVAADATAPSRKMCDDSSRLSRGRTDITSIVINYHRAGTDYTVTITDPTDYWAIFLDEKTAKRYQAIINQECKGKPDHITDPQRLLVPAGTDETGSTADAGGNGAQAAQTSQEGEKRMLSTRRRLEAPDLCYYVKGVWHCW